MLKPRRGDRIEIDIERLDRRGNGLGRLGVYTLLVRGAVPGDRVRARVRKVRNRLRRAEASLEELLSTDIQRSPARCSHFGLCGGCLWQNIPYKIQVRLKQDLVRTCLTEAGIDAELDAPMPSAEPFFYRNKMEFSFGSSPEGRTEVGLHVWGRFDRIFDLDACYLQSETSNRIVESVRNFAGSLSVYHLKRHEGLLRFLTIREGKLTGETMVVITTSGDAFPQAESLGKMLEETFPEVKSVIRSVNLRRSQVAIGDHDEVLAGMGTVRETLGDFTFEISPGSFFQTNTRQAQHLYRRVVELADPGPDDRILDVYCGTGAISLHLSQKAGYVLGIEAGEGAVQDAIRNSAINGVSNCRFIAGAAEDVLWQIREQGERFETVVTDPPRPGMHLKAITAICDLRPERIVYVSCNPEALGADLVRLESSGYKTDYVQLVDMFPHTPHCEVVARLKKSA